MQDIPAPILSDVLTFDYKKNRFNCSSTVRNYVGNTICGVAFNTIGRFVTVSSQDRYRIEMLGEMTPGDLQVVSNCNFNVACYGDISARLAQRRGCVGAFIDGPIRDITYMPNGFGVAYESVNPRDAYDVWEIDHTGGDIYTQDNLRVRHKDVMHIGPEGIVVIPKAFDLEEVLDKAKTRVVQESNVRVRMHHGEDPLKIYDEEQRW